MKKLNLILWIVVVFLSLISSRSFSRDYVCVDPGHGGPGASQYGCNGWGYNENAGSYGPVYQLSEQWVNLQVVLGIKRPHKNVGKSLENY